MAVQIFVGTVKGAFIYRKSAGRWTLEGPILPGWKVSAVARDGAGGFVAASASFVYGAMIHKGPNLVDWEIVNKPPRYTKRQKFKMNEVWTLEQAGKAIFAGVDEAGLFVSRDLGATWDEVKGLTQHSTRKAWFPGFGGLCAHHVISSKRRLWCAISAVGVFYSSDAGKTWTTRNKGVPVLIEDKKHKDIGACVHAIVADPEDANRIWRQDHVGMFRTHNGGRTWQEIQNGQPSNFAFPLARDHGAKALFNIPLASDQFRYPPGGRLSVYRSMDDGDSWQECHRGLPKSNYHAVLRAALAVDQKGGVYFGNAGGEVYASDDLGGKFKRLPGSLPRILCVEAFVD